MSEDNISEEIFMLGMNRDERFTIRASWIGTHADNA